MHPQDIHALCNTLDNAMAAPWAGEANLIGTMIDRHIVKLGGVGDYSDDAILVFLEAIRNASHTSPLFGNMWKTIRDDRTVDLWLYDHQERWRSVSFEIQFHRTWPVEDLYMIVSTFVPMGIDGDRAHYPQELNTAYIRSTQELRAVVSMHAKRLTRGTFQEMDASEQHRSDTHSKEIMRRSSFGQTSTSGVRDSYTNSGSTEGVVVHRHGWLTNTERPKESSTTMRGSSGSERVQDYRNERTSTGTTEESRSERHHTEALCKRATTQIGEDQLELTEDVSFMAVGPDFTHPEGMIKAWRADPGNRESSMTIDLMLCGLPALSKIIEQGVSHRRMSSRARRRAGEGVDFWKEADELIARYNASVYGKRVVLTHDGYPRAIEPGDIASAINQARGGLGQLTGRSHFLLEGGR